MPFCGFVSLPCVLGPLGKFVSVIGWITQESDSEMNQACRSLILDCSWSSPGGRDEMGAGWAEGQVRQLHSGALELEWSCRIILSQTKMLLLISRWRWVTLRKRVTSVKAALLRTHPRGARGGRLSASSRATGLSVKGYLVALVSTMLSFSGPLFPKNIFLRIKFDVTYKVLRTLPRME